MVSKLVGTGAESKGVRTLQHSRLHLVAEIDRHIFLGYTQDAIKSQQHQHTKSIGVEHGIENERRNNSD